MPSFDLSDIQVSTALLQESNASHRTAWLVESTDLIITAGHNFDKDESYFIKFCDREAFQVKVLDCRFNEDQMIDYAVLKAPKDKIRGIPGIAISWKRIKQTNGKEFVLNGYRDSVPDLNTEVTGTLTGTAVNINGAKKYYLQLGIQPEELNGLSGAAICVEGDDNIYRAVGIFTSQIARARNTCFGMPFERIKADSSDLRPISNRPNTPSPQKLTIDQRIAPKISLPEDKMHRYAILDLEEDNALYSSPNFSDLLDKIGGQWELFIDQLSRSRNNLYWLSKGNVPSLYRFYPSNRCGVDSINKSTVYDNTRVVVYSNSHISSTLGIPETFSEASHVVAINLRQPSFRIAEKKSYSMHVDLNGPDSYDLDKDKVFNILEDVLLDLQVFHMLPFLRHFFRSLDDKRAFSLLKAEFIRHNNYKQYGVRSDRSNASYASLASCARNSLPGKLDLEEYKKIWFKFIYNWLFLSTYNDSGSENHVPSFDSEEIINNILSLPRLGGQISERKLKRTLSMDAGKGFHILFIAIRRPRQSKHATEMATFFGREKWKKNMMLSMFYSFPSLKIPFKFIPYLQLYFFCRR
jgi:hypothetical protein